MGHCNSTSSSLDGRMGSKEERAELYAALRAYLYDRLSIEDMEFPETLLAKLDER